MKFNEHSEFIAKYSFPIILPILACLAVLFAQLANESCSNSGRYCGNGEGDVVLAIIFVMAAIACSVPTLLPWFFLFKALEFNVDINSYEINAFLVSALIGLINGVIISIFVHLYYKFFKKSERI